MMNDMGLLVIKILSKLCVSFNLLLYVSLSRLISETPGGTVGVEPSRSGRTRRKFKKYTICIDNKVGCIYRAHCGSLMSQHTTDIRMTGSLTAFSAAVLCLQLFL